MEVEGDTLESTVLSRDRKRTVYLELSAFLTLLLLLNPSHSPWQL